MRNDPKHDHYPIPLELLKEARKQIKRGITREQAAAHIVRILEECVEREPNIRKEVELLNLNLVQMQIVVEDRLKICDPLCVEGQGDAYDRLLNRMRNRRHEQKKQDSLTDEERAERRKRHNDYVRKKRRNPKVRDKERKWRKKNYAKRKIEDPEGYEAYLAEKREKRAAAMQDPEKAKRMKEHAKRNQQARAEKYRTDPEYRAEEQSRARAYYHFRKAQDHNYRRRS